ncbi:MAG: hypothetical protein GY788_09850 [bacterium]|nr:hypothetical protein [bacterium]
MGQRRLSSGIAGDGEFVGEIEITDRTGGTFAGLHRWKQLETATELHGGTQRRRSGEAGTPLTSHPD